MKLKQDFFFQIKKEKPSGDGCKGEPMDTASSSVSSSVTANEDKKPEVKKEPKEEEEGSTGPNSSPANTQSKKKSKFGSFTLLIWLQLSAHSFGQKCFSVLQRKSK